MSEERWTREELILALRLYCKIPFGKIHARNPDIISFANTIDRTANAVSWKLVNFAHLDPSLPRKGASNVSKLDREIWEEFSSDWSLLLEEVDNLTQAPTMKIQQDKDIVTEAIASIKARRGQSFFRESVLSSYNSRCCITGISLPELLVASHIIPWSQSEVERLNPRNGLCLNVLHDKAFDVGLIGLNDDFSLIISSNIKGQSFTSELDFIVRYQGCQITLPERFRPDAEFVQYHRKNIFQG